MTGFRDTEKFETRLEKMMAEKRKEPMQAPFSPSTGSLHSYPEQSSEWRTVEEFDAVLELVGQNRGRSAAHYLWREQDTDRSFSMFMTDMAMMILNFGAEKGGVVRGRWTIQKRGSNYGIRRVG